MSACAHGKKPISAGTSHTEWRKITEATGCSTMKPLFSNWLIAFLVATTLPLSASAKTWYIKADGTGDATFIWSGIDSAAAGDTVLVGPGTYEVGSIVMKDGVILRSEAGPYLTKLVPDHSLPPTAIGCERFVSLRTEISGFWFDGFPDPDWDSDDKYYCSQLRLYRKQYDCGKRWIRLCRCA